jgi:hypothetical protein
MLKLWWLLYCQRVGTGDVAEDGDPSDVVLLLILCFGSTFPPWVFHYRIDSSTNKPSKTKQTNNLAKTRPCVTMRIAK